MSRIQARVQGLAVAAAVAGALSFAAPASALTLLSASMDTSNTVNISGPGGYHKDVYIGPVTFKVTDGGADYLLTAYCIDIFHEMTLGPLNGGAGYAYHNEDATTDSKTSTAIAQAGDALGDFQRDQISSLLTFSNFLVSTGAPDLSHKLAGIQGAIWEIEDPGYTITGASLVMSYINSFKAAAAVTLPVGGMKSIFANDYAHQSFAFGVPEPATWTIMILGLGGIGAAMRRRRAALA